MYNIPQLTFHSCLFDVGELLGEERRGEDLVDGDAAGAGDLADVVGEVALVAAGVRQLRLRDLQTDLRTKHNWDKFTLMGAVILTRKRKD